MLLAQQPLSVPTFVTKITEYLCLGWLFFLPIVHLRNIGLKSSPTRHIKYKGIAFAPANKLIMANKLPSINWKPLLRRIISRVNCPKLAKTAIYKPI